MQPDRQWGLGSYRYGFNGKENDNEVKGEGNQQDYGMRVYDPRLGKFLSVDPLSKKYAFYTPYQFSGNKPIVAVDLDGQEDHIYVISFFDKQGKAFFKNTYNEGNVVGVDRNGIQAYDRPERFVAAYNIAFIDGTEYSIRLAFNSYADMRNVAQRQFYPQATSLAIMKGFDLGLASYSGSELGSVVYNLSSRALSKYATSYATRAAVDETYAAVSSVSKKEIINAERGYQNYGSDLLDDGIYFNEAFRIEIGHTTPYSLMGAAEKKAYQHTYGRHAAELGLPNWKGTQAESLRVLLNKKLTELRTIGAKTSGFFRSKEWVDGVKIEVNRTEPIINGQRYYYYETLDKKFVSAGKMP